MRMPAARFAAAYREVQNAPKRRNAKQPARRSGLFCASAAPSHDPSQHFYPDVEQTPDGITHLGFVGLLRKCVPWKPRRALPPRAPPRLNFTAQQHHFYPNIEQTPDGVTHLGFVGLLRKRAPWKPSRALPPRAPLRLNFTAQQHHFYPNIEQTPDGVTHLGFVQ